MLVVPPKIGSMFGDPAPVHHAADGNDAPARNRTSVPVDADQGFIDLRPRPADLGATVMPVPVAEGDGDPDGRFSRDRRAGGWRRRVRGRASCPTASKDGRRRGYTDPATASVRSSPIPGNRTLRQDVRKVSSTHRTADTGGLRDLGVPQSVVRGRLVGAHLFSTLRRAYIVFPSTRRATEALPPGKAREVGFYRQVMLYASGRGHSRPNWPHCGHGGPIGLRPAVDGRRAPQPAWFSPGGYFAVSTFRGRHRGIFFRQGPCGRLFHLVRRRRD